MGSPMTLSLLTSSDPERSNSRSLTFPGLISCEGAELHHKLLLNINEKAYMESPMTSHMTFSDLEGQIQGHSDFETLYLVKELGHMLLSNKSAENCHFSHQLQIQAGRQSPWTSCSPTTMLNPNVKT